MIWIVNFIYRYFQPNLDAHQHLWHLYGCKFKMITLTNELELPTESLLTHWGWMEVVTTSKQLWRCMNPFFNFVDKQKHWGAGACQRNALSRELLQFVLFWLHYLTFGTQSRCFKETWALRGNPGNTVILSETQFFFPLSSPSALQALFFLFKPMFKDSIAVGIYAAKRTCTYGHSAHVHGDAHTQAHLRELCEEAGYHKTECSCESQYEARDRECETACGRVCGGGCVWKYWKRVSAGSGLGEQDI